MCRIHAKQVIGAVTDSTAQQIGGDKDFIGKVSYLTDEQFQIVIHGGFVYWVSYAAFSQS